MKNEKIEKEKELSEQKLSMADKIAKFEIELFTTHKFEEMSDFERTVIQSLVNGIVLLFIIAAKI